MKAPWPDFAGNEIVDGACLAHPSGEEGVVVFLHEFEIASDQWRVDYGGGELSRLILQIGDKGRAVVST